MGVTIYADRSKIPGKIKLPNVGLLRLNQPTIDVDIPIMAKWDGQPVQLLQTAKFTVPTSPIPPVNTGDVLYDSNVDIDWAAIAAQLGPGEDHITIDDVYGDFVPNGKYFRMKASGNPRMLLFPATKELCLEHDGKYGRGYFGVCNYNSRLECEFKLTDASHKISFKSRCRHQYRDVDTKATNLQRQGGQGTSFGVDEVDADCEIYHDGGEVGGPSGKLSPKLEINKYHSTKFSQFDKDGKIHVIDELNGKVVNEGDVKAPSQLFNKEEFEEWSEFWVRLNTGETKNNRLWFKNLKMLKL